MYNPKSLEIGDSVLPISFNVLGGNRKEWDQVPIIRCLEAVKEKRKFKIMDIIPLNDGSYYYKLGLIC